MSRVPRGLESFLRSLALMRLLQAQGNASPTVNQQLFLTLDHMTQIEKEYKYKSGIAIKSHACHIIPTKTKYIHSLGVSVLVFASLPFLDFFGFFGDLAGFLGLVPLEALGFLGARLPASDEAALCDDTPLCRQMVELCQGWDRGTALWNMGTRHWIFKS